MGERRDPKRAVLFDALDQELRRRPHGTIRAMERALGWAPSWWHNRLRSGDITTRQLLEILDFLEIDAVGFMQRNLDRGDGLPAGLELPLSQAPSFVTSAKERLRSSQDQPGLGRDFLVELAALVYYRSEEALGWIDLAVSKASRRELPEVLGLAASALKITIRLEEAMHACTAAILAARHLSRSRATASLLQTSAYILLDSGDFEHALCMADQAAGISNRTHDPLEVSRSAISQALCLIHLGRFREAISSCEIALGRLPASEALHLSAALQLRALAHQELGEIEAAFEFLEASRPFCADLSKTQRTKIPWVEARLHKISSRPMDSIRLMRGVFGDLRQHHVGEAALAAVELAETLIEQNFGAEAFEVADQALKGARHLEHNPAYTLAIQRLRRQAQEGIRLAHTSLIRSARA